MLSHVGYVGGQRWGHIWYWAYLEPFWANIGLMLSHFGRCVGLCLGLGHFGVVEFCVHARRLQNTEKNSIFWLCCWCFWCYVELCLRGIFLVLRWHLNGTFGVWVVSCWWVSWWSWHGMLWALIIWVDNFNGVLHLCAQTQHTSIPNIKQSCTLLAHDISSAFPVLTGGA